MTLNHRIYVGVGRFSLLRLTGFVVAVELQRLSGRGIVVITRPSQG